LPCSSVLSSITISQNHFIIGLSGVKPFACIATSLRSWKLRNHYPHISCSKSSESKRALRTGKSTILLNPILKEASWPSQDFLKVKLMKRSTNSLRFSRVSKI
jgi:hypothetical protein